MALMRNGKMCPITILITIALRFWFVEHCTCNRRHTANNQQNERQHKDIIKNTFFEFKRPQNGYIPKNANIDF